MNKFEREQSKNEETESDKDKDDPEQGGENLDKCCPEKNKIRTKYVLFGCKN